MLEYTFDTIDEALPGLRRTARSCRRSSTRTGRTTRRRGWQQNRAVVGHNLKIAWNLMRMHGAEAQAGATSRSPRRSATLMPAVGSDTQRGGWYDVVERVKQPGQDVHRFVWHDRKAWWQQEQAILAYLILAGCSRGDEYLQHAREVGRVLQRLLPRPRRRRRLLQHAGERHAVPAGQPSGSRAATR